MTDDLSKLVRPLVWEHHPLGCIAAPPTGRPYIIDIRVKGRVFFIKGMDPPPKVDTIEAAKAAAQADYTARIIAALDPSAVAKIREDALREAAALVDINRTPCSPVYPASWTDDQKSQYESGQLDAAQSFIYAILSLIQTSATQNGKDTMK